MEIEKDSRIEYLSTIPQKHNSNTRSLLTLIYYMIPALINNDCISKLLVKIFLTIRINFSILLNLIKILFLIIDFSMWHLVTFRINIFSNFPLTVKKVII